MQQELTTPFVTPISLAAHTTYGTRMPVCVCVCVRVLYLFTCDPHNENVFNHCPLQSFASGTSTLPFPVVQLNGRCVRFHGRSPTETIPPIPLPCTPPPLCTQMKLHVEMEFEVFLIRRFSHVFLFVFGILLFSLFSFNICSLYILV